jgi:hypothetical protein
MLALPGDIADRSDDMVPEARDAEDDAAAEQERREIKRVRLQRSQGEQWSLLGLVDTELVGRGAGPAAVGALVLKC